MDVDALLQRALAFHQQGQFAPARAIYERILERQPAHFDALHLLGVIAAQAREPARAVEFIGKALVLNPHNAVAHFNIGSALQELRRLDAALASYDRAIAIDPGFAEACSNRGVVLKDLGRLSAALASCDRAIAIRPGYAEAHFNRGVVLYQLQRFAAALASYERAIAIRPDYPEAHFNRGIVFSDMNQLEPALASYDRAVASRADYVLAHVNRGNVLKELGRIDAAIAAYDRAIAIKADCAGAYFNRSVLYLLTGRFDRGWADFEWRWENQHRFSIVAADNQRPQPRWLGGDPPRGDPRGGDSRGGDSRGGDPRGGHSRGGDSRGGHPPAGRTFLLHAEQGLGDTVQFCRYAKLLAERGATVILEAQAPLLKLLEGLEGVSRLIAPGSALPPNIDYQCPLLSLPLAFATTLATIPADVPYLKSSPEKVRFWQEKLGQRNKPRVGLVWSGGFRPEQPELWSVNSRRNIPLSKLAPLKHPDIEFYSLQKGQPAESELAELRAGGWHGPDLVDFTALLTDFSDTAALIECLDLVISVDTSIVHVAGAMAKPVWMLNRFDTCWRWLLDRSDSPWYPTLRLFRQERPGDWDGVVERVRGELLQWVTGRPAWTADVKGGTQ
jgi:tetratricopeptide (TPR) repeat protein